MSSRPASTAYQIQTQHDLHKILLQNTSKDGNQTNKQTTHKLIKDKGDIYSTGHLRSQKSCATV